MRKPNTGIIAILSFILISVTVAFQNCAPSELEVAKDKMASGSLNTQSTLSTTELTILQQPTSVIVRIGDSTVFWVQASGTNKRYLWFKTGSTKVLSTKQILEINQVTASDAGTYYVLITDDTHQVFSSTASLTISNSTSSSGSGSSSQTQSSQCSIANGTGITISGGACRVQSCSEGYHSENDIQCVKNAPQITQCHIANGTGISSDGGPCLVQSCNSGYHVQGDSECVVNAPQITQCHIANGTGVSTNGGICLVQACDSGYHTQGESQCVKNDPVITQCDIANGTGVSSDGGPCKVQSCNAGYYSDQDSQCLKSPPVVTQCDIANGAGQSIDGGPCKVQSCNPGYYNDQDTQCLVNPPVVAQCDIANGTGQSTDGGPCKVQSCNPGYFVYQETQCRAPLSLSNLPPANITVYWPLGFTLDVTPTGDVLKSEIFRDGNLLQNGSKFEVGQSSSGLTGLYNFVVTGYVGSSITASTRVQLVSLPGKYERKICSDAGGNSQYTASVQYNADGTTYAQRKFYAGGCNGERGSNLLFTEEVWGRYKLGSVYTATDGTLMQKFNVKTDKQTRTPTDYFYGEMNYRNWCGKSNWFANAPNDITNTNCVDSSVRINGSIQYQLNGDGTVKGIAFGNPVDGTISFPEGPRPGKILPATEYQRVESVTATPATASDTGI